MTDLLVVGSFAPLDADLDEQALMVGWCEGGPVPVMSPLHAPFGELVYISDAYAHYAMTPYEAVRYLLWWVDEYGKRWER